MVAHTMVTTQFELDGFRVVRTLGVVRGIVVRSRSIIGTFGATLQTLVGGNITLLTNLCEKTRSEAFDLMLQHAAQLGGNADCDCWHGNRSMGPDQSRPILERQDCAQSRSSTDSLRTLRAHASSNLLWSSARRRRNCGSCEPMARRAGVCAAVYQLFDQGETGGQHSSCSLSGRVRRSQELRRFPAAASVLKEIIT